MNKKILVWLIPLFAVLLPAGFTPPTASAQSPVCAEEYTVQTDDWLSNISAKFLGEVTAYPAIAAITNQQHANDSTFAKITNPDELEVGWKICIPTAESAPAWLTATTDTNALSLSGGLTVTDALGRSVSFDAPPQRIVVAGKAIFMLADALYMFPAGVERVVTLPSGAQSIGDFLSLVDPAFNQKTFLENNAGPEQIAAAQPDVVILKSYMAEKLGTPLEQLGIPVIYIDLETPAQYQRDLTTLGQLLGTPERAAAILDFYQQRVDQVSQAMAGLSDDEKPRVLLVQYSDKGSTVAFKVPPTGWIQTMLVEMAGGTPIWGEAAIGGGWTIVSFEQIAAWDPDQIFVIDYFGDPQQVVDTINADPQWQSLSATENGQLYAFPKDFYSWDQPDPRWILGLEWLATKIQPDRMERIDMRQEINQFYTETYGLTPTTIENKVMPKVQGLP